MSKRNDAPVSAPVKFDSSVTALSCNAVDSEWQWNLAPILSFQKKAYMLFFKI